MGLFSQSLISGKYTNAFVIDANNEGYFVQIKFILGDYFLVTIKKQLYCFRLVGQRQVNVAMAGGLKNYKIYVFFTDHYMPVDGKMVKELEEILKENTLPRVDERHLSLLKILGGKEKHLVSAFKEHDLDTILSEISNKADKYPEAVESLKNFIDGLTEKKISTPVKRVSEFLEGDLVTTDPRFYGMVAQQYNITDKEQKKMSNTPEKGKTAWLKIMLIVVLIGAVGGIGYIVYSSGMIGGITLPGSQIGGGNGQLTDQQLMQKYSTPVSMKCAIKNGDLQYNSLSPKMKSFVDTVKGEPDCTPIPAPIIPQVPQIKLPGQH